MSALARCLMLAAALAPLPALAVDTATQQARLDQQMQAYTGNVPGAAVLVLKDGQPVLRSGYGMAELETQRAVTPATNFRLASVSKQFTAAAILLLAERGALGIDDPLARWLPGLPAATEAVTLRHLLNHTSGLLDYEDLMDPADTRQVHDRDVFTLLQPQNRLYFPAGSNYRYSNSGYALLALVVEKASGQAYPAFLRQHIFEKLGMTNTHARTDAGPAIPERAYGYSEADGQWQRTDQSTTSAVLGDGGIYSSLDDLARWDAALYDERLLSAASLKQAFTAGTHTDEADVAGYGFGWRINGDALWHSGESIGFRNVMIRYPTHKLTVIVLTNRNDPAPYPLALEIAKHWLPANQ